MIDFFQIWRNLLETHKLIENNFLVGLRLMSILCLARVIPHPPNFTPVFCVALLTTYLLPPVYAIGFTLISLLISDIGIAFINHQPIVGTWSFFTYSGLFIAIVLSIFFKPNWNLLKQFSRVMTISCFYWIWTNLGVWIVEVIYPHTLSGFIACYVAALPFLTTSLLGNLMWGIVLFIPFYWTRSSHTCSGLHPPCSSMRGVVGSSAA